MADPFQFFINFITTMVTTVFAKQDFYYPLIFIKIILHFKMAQFHFFMLINSMQFKALDFPFKLKKFYSTFTGGYLLSFLFDIFIETLLNKVIKKKIKKEILKIN